MGFEIWMVVNRELEEEGGDADDGEHQEVRDEEGAASVLQRDRKWDLGLEGNVIILSILEVY